MRILLIEDDRLIGDGLKKGLEKNALTVDWFTDGVTGAEALLQTSYDAVILDLGLPEWDGLTVLRYWRDKGRTEPVLILTAQGDVDCRVTGLNSGADDYMAKPFSLKEVQARLHALIRRQLGQSMPERRVRDVCLNPQTCRVTKAGQPILLAPKEFKVLDLLMCHKNKVMSREQIEEKIYAWDEDVASNALEVHIHHLRQKLGKTFIQTVPKLGYMIED